MSAAWRLSLLVAVQWVEDALLGEPPQHWCGPAVLWTLTGQCQESCAFMGQCQEKLRAACCPPVNNVDQPGGAALEHLSSSGITYIQSKRLCSPFAGCPFVLMRGRTDPPAAGGCKRLSGEWLPARQNNVFVLHL